MNERIIELVEQAANEYTQNFSWEHLLQIDKDIFEKFAALIIRECAEVCANRGKMHDGLYSAWADDCSKRIGKHFGVEE